MKQKELYDEEEEEVVDEEETKEEKKAREKTTSAQKAVKRSDKKTIEELDKPVRDLNRNDINEKPPEIREKDVGINVPIIELEKPSIQIKTIELDYTIPEITTKEVEITIPIIELNKPNMQIKVKELDYTMPEITTKEVEITIPIIELDKPNIQMKATELDYTMPEITTKEVDITVPIIELDKPNIQIKATELDCTMPEITTKEVEITVPIIQLNNPNIQIKARELNYTMPEITTKEVEITVPVIELEKPHIQMIATELDYTMPKIHSEERRVEVPLIRVEKPKKVISIIKTFNDKLPPVKEALQARHDIQMSGKSSIEKEEKEVIEGSQTAEVISHMGKLSGGGEFEEVPDIVEFVFGIPDGKISSSRPKIVLYKELEEDSTIGSFETLCMRIYREKEGGEPKIQPIKKLDDFNIKEIEKRVSPNKRIVTIDLDSDKDKAGQWFREESLREPLRKYIIGNGDFIIFKTRDERLYEQCKKVLENLKIEYEHSLDIVYVQPKSLPIEIIRMLSSLAWGNINLDDVIPLFIKEKNIDRVYGDTLDDIFNKKSKDVFEERLESLEEERYVYATEQHEGGESNEHYWMKVFIVKLLAKERKLNELVKIKEIIKTEEEYEGVIPDIRVGESVYEVETLFAEDREGKIPKKKIENTITKYENTSIREINIVLDNLTFLRHLGDLIEINKVLKDWTRNHGKIIRFWTLDIQNGKLLPLEEVIKRIKSLQTPTSS